MKKVTFEEYQLYIENILNDIKEVISQKPPTKIEITPQILHKKVEEPIIKQRKVVTKEVVKIVVENNVENQKIDLSDI